MKDNINQAVAGGAITQAQAGWLLQGLDNGDLNGLHGFGFGDGHGRGPGGPLGTPLGGAPGDSGSTQPAPGAPARSTQS